MLPMLRTRDGERGSAAVEFALVSIMAIAVFLTVAQLAVYLWERNVVMGSLAEGVRVAAREGGTVSEGRQRAVTLIRSSIGARVASAVPVAGADLGDRVGLRVDGAIPALVRGIPAIPMRLTVTMHKETALVPVEPALE